MTAATCSCCSNVSAFIADGRTFCQSCWRFATYIPATGAVKIQRAFKYAGRSGSYVAGQVSWGGAHFQVAAAGPELRAAIVAAIESR